MAHRLNPALVLVALSSLFACGAGRALGASASSDVAAIRSATDATARALARFYEASNDGVNEAYVARALARRVLTGRAERCRLPSGALSTRPTVLANPLLPRSSVVQREAVVATIGAYEAMLVALTNGSAAADVTLAQSDFQKELVGLRTAANTHAQGDLFIEDAAEALTHESHDLAQGDRTAQLRVIESADPVVRKLIAILSGDIARQRVDTMDAAALAYRGWLSYAGSARPASAPLHYRALGDPPFCSEPAIYARDKSWVPGPNSQSTPGNGLVGKRVARARDRLDAVRRANPLTVVSALAALDDDAIQALRGTQSPEAADAARPSIERFTLAAQAFANSLPVTGAGRNMKTTGSRRSSDTAEPANLR